MDYWIIVDGKPVGPLTVQEIFKRQIAPDTKVWHSGMSEWLEASKLPEFQPMWIDSPVNVHTESTTEPPSPSTPPTPPSPAPEQPHIPLAQPNPHYHEPAPEPQQRPAQPPTYLGWNVVLTICCCFVGGVIGVVFSVLTSSKYNAGDYEGAEKMSRRAEIMVIVNIVLGLVSIPFSLLFNLLSL